MNKKTYDIIAAKLGLTESDVRFAYEHYWRYCRKYIESLPFDQGLNEEQIKELKTDIHISRIGKFYIRNVNKAILYNKKNLKKYANNRSKANAQSHTDNS